MRAKGLLLFLVLLPYWFYAQSLPPRLLQDRLSASTYDDLFADLATWQSSRATHWRNALRALPDTLQQQILRAAKRANSFAWPPLLASSYLAYKRHGNRLDFDQQLSQRRSVLSALVLGEVVQGNGAFIPQIANGLWLTLEESTWVGPAHIVSQKAGIGLSDPYDSYIDLGAARFAADLAAIYRLLATELDAYDPQLRRRISYELDRRILKPYAWRKDFWWMGYQKGTINNWNIWINNNVLRTAVLLMDKGEEQQQLILKIMESADKFIDYYPADGACEEGPSYWIHAGGELGAMLALLKDLTKGRFAIGEEGKLHRMGRYILDMHIGGNRYVNFADALAIEYVPAAKVGLYGELFKDQDLANFAAYLWQQNPFVETSNVQDALLFACHYPAIAKAIPRAEKKSLVTYPSLELVKWMQEASGVGLTFVAIGGHNGVSHNHNDVGSFMLFADRIPVLIDVGVGTYNGKTFSAARYDIWNMQSQWHNLPLINGYMQEAGKGFRATNVELPSAGAEGAFRMDIGKAYPAKAEIERWVRSFRFLPKQQALLLEESYVLKKEIQPQEFMYLTTFAPAIKMGEIWIAYSPSSRLVLKYDATQLAPIVADRILDDPRHQKVWGEKIYRIRFVEKRKRLKASYAFTMRLERTEK